MVESTNNTLPDPPQMRNGGSPPAHLSSYTAFALKKDFYRHWEEAELDNELIDRHRHDKATRAMAIEVRWLRLKEEVRIGINKDLNLVLLRAKAFDDERLRLLAEERPQTTASAELVLAEVSCCHDAGTYIAMSTESSRADERHRHKAAAQAAESAVLLLAEDRRRHEAPELATPMRSLAASRDCADIEAFTYEAPALPTTISPEPPAMLSPSPRPTSSYLGAVLNINRGGIRLCIRCRLPWRLHHQFPSLKTYPFGSAIAPDLIVALDAATVLALPAF